MQSRLRGFTFGDPVVDATHAVLATRHTETIARGERRAQAGFRTTICSCSRCSAVVLAAAPVAALRWYAFAVEIAAGTVDTTYAPALLLPPEPAPDVAPEGQSGRSPSAIASIVWFDTLSSRLFVTL